MLSPTVQHKTRTPAAVLLCTLAALLAPSCIAQIGFAHSAGGPVVAAANSNKSWHAQHAANPTVLNFNGTYFMYFRGIANGQASTIGMWTASGSGFNGVNWNQSPANNPILTPNPSGFDATGTYDPSAVVFNGQLYLYLWARRAGPAASVWQPPRMGFASPSAARFGEMAAHRCRL